MGMGEGVPFHETRMYEPIPHVMLANIDEAKQK